MRQFNPFSTMTFSVYAIVKQTQNAILIKYKKDTLPSDYVWFPRGWLYNIKYTKVKAKDGTVSKRTTLVFYGFLETEIKLKMQHLLVKKKDKKKK